MNLPLEAIELDTSIQCRASIDTGVVNDYAERMKEGDEFPPIEVFGTKAKCWIADGWHRVLAARQNAAETIDAHLSAGGRVDALKAALGANAVHGQRRSNADKRRSVEIALREFPKLSSRAVAKLCGVSDPFVNAMRPAQVQTVSTSERTGQDGKSYPAARRVVPDPQEPGYAEPVIDTTSFGDHSLAPAERPVLGPPRDGMQFARMAVMDLEQIREDDAERAEALAFVKEWIDAR